MTALATTKEQRFDVRLEKSEKERIQSAASLRGQKAAAFARETLLREADTVMAEHRRITLSAQESRRFLEELDRPFEPNDKLARALARFHR